MALNVLTRKFLRDRIGLDSDVLGKQSFSYDSHSILLQNWDWMLREMLQCPLWRQVGLVQFIARLKEVMQSQHKYADLSGRLIYRTYLLSAWYNRNRYLQIQ